VRLRLAQAPCVLWLGQIFTLDELKDRDPMRTPVLAGSVVLALAMGVAACSKPAPQETASAVASLDATPENAPGTALTDATVQLPAVAGNPGVAYFTLTQGSGPARQLVAVHVDGAGRAEMHESAMKNGMMEMTPIKSLALESGKSLEFKPGGNHVMLFDLAPTLKAGGVTELTITLDNGDKATTRAKVVTPGGGDAPAGDMAHMDHM